MIEFYNKLNEFKEEKGLEFLGSSMKMLTLLDNIIQNLHKENNKNNTIPNIPKKNKLIENAFYTFSGNTIYLKETQWIAVHALLLKNNHLDKCNTGNDIINEIKTVRPEKDLEKTFKNCFAKSIELIKKDVQNKKQHYKTINIYFNIKSLDILLQHYLTSLISRRAYLNDHNKNNSEITLIFKSTAESIGLFLLETFVQTNSFCKDIYKAFKPKPFKNQAVEIKVELILTLTQLLLAYRQKDYMQVRLILNENGVPNTEDKVFVDALCNYIFLLLLRQVKQQNIPDMSLLRELSFHNLEKVFYEEKLKKYYIQTGAIIIYALQTVNIFDKHVETPVYHENKDLEELNNIIKVNPDIAEEFLDINNFKKPFLHLVNIKHYGDYDFFTDKNNVNASEYFIHEHLNNFVIDHDDLSLTINEKSYLNDKDNSPYTLQVVDRNYLIQILSWLQVATKLRFVNTQEYLDTLKIIFSIYDIDYDLYISTRTEEYENNKKLFDALEDFYINFNTLYSSTIRPLIKISTVKNPSYFYTLLQKISQNKLTFIKGIQETIIYSGFKYFFNGFFLDSRGRFYCSGIFTNTQLYPILKSIIKPFIIEQNQSYIENNFDFIKNNFINIIKKDSLKNQIEKMTLDNYKQEENALELANIYKLFNADYSYDKFISLFDQNIHDFDILTNIISFIKKNKNVFYVHSMIMLLKNKINKDNYDLYKNISNYFELDATASGLQLTSLIFREETLGTLVNVVGTEKTDIYENAARICKEKTDETLLLNDMFTNIINYDLSNIEASSCSVVYENKMLLKRVSGNTDILIDSDYTLLLAFFSFNHETSPGARILMERLQDAFNTNIPLKKFVEDYTIFAEDPIFNKRKPSAWILSTEELKLIKKYKNHDNKNYLNVLFIIKNCILYTNALKQYPWLRNILEKRNSHKKPLMTYGYNATAFRRREELQDLFHEFDHNLKVHSPYIRQVIHMVERIFKHFIETHLPACEQLIELSHDLAKRKKNVIIQNKNFKIVFYTTKKEKIRIATTSLTRNLTKTNKNRMPTVNATKNTYEFDSAAFIRKFSPNFIHSADASLVHYFNERLVSLNKLFKLQGFLIGFGTNHDTFWMTLPPFLKILLKDCYYELYNEIYLNTIILGNSTADTFNIQNKFSKAFQPNKHFEELNDNFVK